MGDNPEPASHFLALPAELREQIYRLILSPAANRVSGPDDYDTYDYGAALALLLVSQQVYYEARAAFRALNVFVKIETPWPEAQDHVEVEGHVPVLLKGRRAARFAAHTLAVAIEAPLIEHNFYDDDDEGVADAVGGGGGTSSDDDVDHAEIGNGNGTEGRNRSRGRSGHRSQHFVILLDDLPKFTRTWFYSDLSNPGLNRYLGLRLQLRDPHAPAWEEKYVAKALQRQLLLPFGEVKNLRRLAVVGDPAPLSSIEAELRALQAVPPASAETCLSDAARLKAEGNALLNAGDFRGALDVYGRAWEAMHIVVRGRQRHIHAEAYFARRLEDGGEQGDGNGNGDGSSLWRGRNGAMERLVLRVQLVANTCLVYLKLKMWDEVCFWGTRSIGMMRQARLAGPMMNGNGVADIDMDIVPEEEAVLGFPAAIQSE